jgi:SEFIR domain
LLKDVKVEEERPPKVFISYSHDSDEHRDRVLDLAHRLWNDGIVAEIDQYIDQYNPSPHGDWPLWCERQIDAADFLLIVCTEIYHRRFKGDEEQGKGLGVFWEAQIIRRKLYSGADRSKFIPVLFSDSSPEHIPTEGLSLWLRRCLHVVANGPGWPVTDKMLIEPEATV